MKFFEDYKKIGKDIGNILFVVFFVSALFTLFFVLIFAQTNEFKPINVFYAFYTFVNILTLLVSYIFYCEKKNLNKFYKVFLLILSINIIITTLYNFFINYSNLFVTYWWQIIVGLLIITEILFWFIDKDKPKKKDNVIVFSLFIKLKNYGLSILGLFGLIVVGTFFKNLYKWFKEYFKPEFYQPILNFLGQALYWILIVVLIGLVLYIYLWLNSLKYKKP
jgi:hypothetical protein